MTDPGRQCSEVSTRDCGFERVLIYEKGVYLRWCETAAAFYCFFPLPGERSAAFASHARRLQVVSDALRKMGVKRGCDGSFRREANS